MNGIKKSHIDFSDLSDVSELVDLHNFYYGTQRKPENWMWQYRGFKPSKAVFTMAKHNGEIIGTQAMMPYYMNVGGKIVLTGKSENTLLKPEYRGRKIMEDLYEYAVELCIKRGYEFIWGFTGAIRAFQKFGFSVYPLPQTFWRPGLNIRAGLTTRFQEPNLFWRKFAVMGKFGLDYIQNLGSLTLPKIPENIEYQTLVSKVDLSQLSGLQNQLHSKYSTLISPHFDEKYLDWRIRRHPFLNYHEYQVLKNGILLAYGFVVKKNGAVSISDMVSMDDYASKILLRQVILDFQKQTGQFKIFINPKSKSTQSLVEVFKLFGFQPREISNLVVRDISSRKYSEVENLESWVISGLWTEGYSM